MPFFKVVLSGTGILLPCDGAADPVIGFFTTRTVRARNSGEAQVLAKEIVLSEWRAGGTYAAANGGSVPALTTDRISSLGFLRGFFGHKEMGYSFYLRDD